ncbi:MAG TPA: DOPA 4,5-dioxygenase family protein [Luteibacter sp.]|nr:DOPA 4,5-dioxygenase family protein [Luteibacter sp.]
MFIHDLGWRILGGYVAGGKVKSTAAFQREDEMNDNDAPYHAHIYYVPETRAVAEVAHNRLRNMLASGEIPQLLFVGQLKDGKAGPHPIAQFEIHYTKEALPAVLCFIEASGLTALVHPLTDDDLADHTSLAHWIGTPLDLDLTRSIRPARTRALRVSRSRISSRLPAPSPRQADAPS